MKVIEVERTIRKVKGKDVYCFEPKISLTKKDKEVLMILKHEFMPVRFTDISIMLAKIIAKNKEIYPSDYTSQGIIPMNPHKYMGPNINYGFVESKDTIVSLNILSHDKSLLKRNLEELNNIIENANILLENLESYTSDLSEALKNKETKYIMRKNEKCFSFDKNFNMISNDKKLKKLNLGIMDIPSGLEVNEKKRIDTYSSLEEVINTL